MILPDTWSRKPHPFSGWKQQPVNSGAHAEQAVQYDAEKKKPRGGPCKRHVRPTGNDVSAHYCEEYVHDSNATDSNATDSNATDSNATKPDGMHALPGNAKRIAVLA